MSAVRNMLPVDLGEIAVFKKTDLNGHHGNPITLIEVELADRQLLLGLLRKIGSGLTALDKETLSREMSLHLEKGKKQCCELASREHDTEI